MFKGEFWKDGNIQSTFNTSCYAPQTLLDVFLEVHYLEQAGTAQKHLEAGWFIQITKPGAY